MTPPSTAQSRMGLGLSFGDRMPVPVEIIRTRRKSTEWIAMLIGSWAGTFVSSAVTMLLIGACHQEIDSRIPAFGYVQTLLALYTLKTIVGAVAPWDAYKLWSREAKARRG